MTSIEDLPRPVLFKIFNYVDWNPGVLEAVAKFSKTLDLFIRGYELFGMIKYSKYEITINNDNAKICRFEENGKFTHLSVNTLNPVYPEMVSSLNFKGIIQLQDYNNLAEQLVNLRRLRISWLNLEVAGKSEAWTTFPELEQLILGGPSVTNLHDRTPDIKGNTKQGANNLGGLMSLLCRTYFPKLESLGLSIIFEPAQENALVNSILTFLSKHQRTLKTLWIFLTADLKSNEHGFLKQDWTHVPNFECRLDELTLNLDHFFLQFYPYVEAKNVLQLIDRISSTQTSIDFHMLMYPRYQTFYTNIFEDNFRTLTQVAISIWIFETLDCKVFEQCTLLEGIFLLARPKKPIEFETENYRGEPAQSELTNIQYLPKTLKFIGVVNFYIETKHTLLFVSEFPHLTLLCLDGIGEKENLGCGPEMVSDLLHGGRHMIVINRGFNRRLMQINESDDPATAFFKLTWLSAWKTKGKDHVWSLSKTSAGTADEQRFFDESDIYEKGIAPTLMLYQLYNTKLSNIHTGMHAFYDSYYPKLENY